METAVRIVVNGLGGQRCTFEASTEWTILQVQNAIFDLINISVDWQTLLCGTEALGWEGTVGNLMSQNHETIQLTLVVEEVPEPGALLEAILDKEVATALHLLRRRHLPGFSDIIDNYGETVLHEALSWDLHDVAMAIASRPDFSSINAKNHWNHTALHVAAYMGYLSVCKVILGRGDFNQLMALDIHRRRASQLALQGGHHDVVEYLRHAEAQLCGERR